MKINLAILFTIRLILIWCCFICVSHNASAGLFTLNDTTDIESLSLSESFSSFYRYGKPNKASANTGYEEEGTAVMFLADYNDELALITLLDAAGTSHATRRAKMTLSDFNTSDIVLVDDSGESTATGFKWRWVSCCTDGMVYKITDNNSFDIDINFYDIVGLSQFKFLSFDGDTVVGENILSTSFSIQSKALAPQPTILTFQANVVTEPAIVYLFVFALVGLVSSNRVKK